MFVMLLDDVSLVFFPEAMISSSTLESKHNTLSFNPSNVKQFNQLQIEAKMANHTAGSIRVFMLYIKDSRGGVVAISIDNARLKKLHSIQLISVPQRIRCGFLQHPTSVPSSLCIQYARQPGLMTEMCPVRETRSSTATWRRTTGAGSVPIL